MLHSIDRILGQPDVGDEDVAAPHGANPKGEKQGPENPTEEGVLFVGLVQEHVEGDDEAGEHEDDDVDHRVQDLHGVAAIVKPVGDIEGNQKQLPPGQELAENDDDFGPDGSADALVLC